MKSKRAVIAAFVITLAVIAVVAFLMNRDSKPAEYRIGDGKLTISCTFGVAVPLSEISAPELTETAPEVRSKTNGSGIGTVSKGEFLLSDGSAARLYIDSAVPPFIRFTQGGRVFYINAGTAETTQALYDELLAALG
jgi:hypothetical protein